MIDKKKVKEIKKTLKKNEKVKTGKHTNIIEMKLNYDKGDTIPSGIRMRINCTMIDKILALVYLMEVISSEAAAEDKSVTSFLANCMKAYADAYDSED